MSALKICGAAFVCLVALIAVRNMKENFVPLLRFASGIIFLGIVVLMLPPIISFGTSVIEKSKVSEYGEVVLKALGIAYLTHITAHICRDCGENGIGEGIETAGKIELLILALPLFSEVLSIVEEMLSW